MRSYFSTFKLHREESVKAQIIGLYEYQILITGAEWISFINGTQIGHQKQKCY